MHEHAHPLAPASVCPAVAAAQLATLTPLLTVPDRHGPRRAKWSSLYGATHGPPISLRRYCPIFITSVIPLHFLARLYIHTPHQHQRSQRSDATHVIHSHQQPSLQYHYYSTSHHDHMSPHRRATLQQNTPDTISKCDSRELYAKPSLSLIHI